MFKIGEKVNHFVINSAKNTVRPGEEAEILNINDAEKRALIRFKRLDGAGKVFAKWVDYYSIKKI